MAKSKGPVASGKASTPKPKKGNIKGAASAHTGGTSYGNSPSGK